MDKNKKPVERSKADLYTTFRLPTPKSTKKPRAIDDPVKARLMYGLKNHELQAASTKMYSKNSDCKVEYNPTRKRKVPKSMRSIKFIEFFIKKKLAKLTSFLNKSDYHFSAQVHIPVDVQDVFAASASLLLRPGKSVVVVVPRSVQVQV